MRTTFTIAALTLAALMACKAKRESVPSQDDLKKEQMASKENFLKKYNGKPLSIFGKVDDLDLSGAPHLYFESDVHEAKAFTSMYCRIDDADQARFKQLNVGKGSYARVGGTVKADGELDFELQHCKLEAIGTDAMFK